ncbi:TPA: hypothetical protein ACX96Z_002016 [Clostridium sporogenes]
MMITYEDLPEDLKVMYSREQLEALIKAGHKFVGDCMENIKKMIIAMQPILQEAAKEWKKLIEDINLTEEVENHIERYIVEPKYPPYKPKIKRMMVYRKPVYHHIRSNC